MKLDLNIGPLGPDGTIKLQAFVALARQGEQGIQGPQGDTGPQGPQGEQGPGIAPDDPRLSDAREWTAATVTQAEAEAGAATTRRAWTAERVRQAILGWWGGFAAKATPVDADSLVIADSAASNAPKKLTWANAVAKLKGTFVEGPASSVDGDVMLFGGASGKLAKSGGALGPYATLARQGLPYFNLLASNGRLMGTGADIWSPNNTTAAFSIASDYFPTNHNGASTASAGKATSNSSTLGGEGAPLPQTLIDWFGMGLHGNIRYFPEFYVAEITQGAAPTIGKRTVGGNDYYTIGYPNASSSYIATGTATVMLWVRAIDQPAIVFSGAAWELRKNLVSVDNNTLINVADGWVHLSIQAAISPSSVTTYYFNEILSLGIQAGAKVQYMLGFVTPGLMPPFKHIMPILGYRQT